MAVVDHVVRRVGPVVAVLLLRRGVLLRRLLPHPLAALLHVTGGHTPVVGPPLVVVRVQVHPNNGVGWACTAQDEQADGHSRSCLYERQTLDVFDPANNHWKNADQILAIGDVDGPLDTDNDGAPDVAGYPDLLVKEGDFLWLYYGSKSFYLDASQAPVLVGDGSWSNYDLLAPGDRTGNGRVDLIARHKTGGELRLYQGTGPAGEGLGNGTASAIIGTGWTRAHRPLLTAFPDAGSDGKADIFATGGDDKLYLYSNLSGSGVAVGTSGWLDFQALS
ncbi:hypothetical protein [Streptomyces anulatus]|uniref:hypothetical protein n=1 Tax=Streptomyces anulatus TaxID=1892 RepID=UPI00386BFD3E|nr:hypothetical protein OG238_22455 [Streptomyces anulatus]